MGCQDSQRSAMSAHELSWCPNCSLPSGMYGMYGYVWRSGRAYTCVARAIGRKLSDCICKLYRLGIIQFSRESRGDASVTLYPELYSVKSLGQNVVAGSSSTLMHTHTQTTHTVLYSSLACSGGRAGASRQEARPSACA